MTVMSSIVVVSDRILAGERPNAAARQCAERMAAEGLAEPAVRVVREAREAVEEAIRQALDAGHRLVLVLGGSGFRAGNDAPEAARAFIDVELPGVAESIRAHGLSHTLSRAVAGLTARDRTGALIVTSPGSKGGASDTLDVLLPLVDRIFAQLDEV